MPINRECPKCGHMEARVRHNQVLDEMEMECPLCKYEWRLKPLDVLRADKERQAASTQETAVVTEEGCAHCQGIGKLGTPASSCPFCGGEGVRRRDALNR